MSRRTRRTVLASVGTTVAVGLAGCSGGGSDGEGGGDGDANQDTADPTSQETAGSAGTSSGSKSLTLKATGNSDYSKEVVTVESLRFVAAATDATSPTIEVGKSVDLSKGKNRDAVTIAEGLAVPYGTYKSVEMTVTPEEVIDGQGSSVDVSAGTVSRSFTELDDEPNTVEQSRFDATLTLYLSIRNGQFEVTGYKASGLG